MSRGMKKFLPFASLKEQAIFLSAMQKEKVKVEKPEISDDIKEQINAILCDNADKTLLIYYFDKGYIKTVSSVIKKIDVLNRILILPNQKISFENILNIEIED